MAKRTQLSKPNLHAEILVIQSLMFSFPIHYDSNPRSLDMITFFVFRNAKRGSTSGREECRIRISAHCPRFSAVRMQLDIISPRKFTLGVYHVKAAEVFSTLVRNWGQSLRLTK